MRMFASTPQIPIIVIRPADLLESTLALTS